MSVIIAAICGITMGAAPFVLVNETVDAAIIAGIFSVVNTWLNVFMIRRQRQTLNALGSVHEDVAAASEVAAKVAEVVPLRRSDLPDSLNRRSDDQ